ESSRDAKPSARLIGLLLMLLAGCAAKLQIASAPPPPAPAPRAWLLHLPGIGGEMWLDRNLIAGLRDGEVDAEMRIYDWTGADRGIVALGSTARHVEQANKVAEMIAAVYHADPRRRIIVTSHSAGTGIAVWALEQLPDNVQIDTLLMMQSALSPTYDLSKALAHVRGQAYSFWSILDPVVGGGTKLLG